MPGTGSGWRRCSQLSSVAADIRLGLTPDEGQLAAVTRGIAGEVPQPLWWQEPGAKADAETIARYVLKMPDARLPDRLRPAIQHLLGNRPAQAACSAAMGGKLHRLRRLRQPVALPGGELTASAEKHDRDLPCQFPSFGGVLQLCNDGGAAPSCHPAAAVDGVPGGPIDWLHAAHILDAVRSQVGCIRCQ